MDSLKRIYAGVFMGIMLVYLFRYITGTIPLFPPSDRVVQITLKGDNRIATSWIYLNETSEIFICPRDTIYLPYPCTEMHPFIKSSKLISTPQSNQGF